MKKVLILTYYWPPAGGPGVQRVLKFAKYLPDFGWQPIILTVHDGEFPAMDKSLLDDIPKICKVYRAKSLEPFFLYKKLTGKEKDYKIPTYVLTKTEDDQPIERFSKWIRANFFIPDAKIGWIPFAVRKGMQIIEKENIDLIFSSSPPHSVQLIASKLAKKSGLKWIADFRDPWIDAFWIQDLPKLSLVKKIEKRLEESVLKKANVIVSVSKSLAEQFAKKAPNNYQIITNGFDEDDYKNISGKKDPTKFSIIYTGYMAESQNPVNFFRAIKNIDQSIATKIEVIFWGKTHDVILKTIMELNLQEKITLKDYVSHEEIIQHIFNSDMLLIIIPKTERSEHIITGKIFEYIRAKNFILGIGNKQGDAAEILNNTKCGVMFDFTEPVHDIIVQRFNKWQDKIPMQVNHQEIEKYSRKILTKKLVEIFAMVEHR